MKKRQVRETRKNGERCCVSNKLASGSFWSVEANTQNKKFALAFLSFFRPPILSEKGKGKILFCGRRSFSGGDGARSYHRAWGVRYWMKLPPRVARGKVNRFAIAFQKRFEQRLKPQHKNVKNEISFSFFTFL